MRKAFGEHTHLNFQGASSPLAGLLCILCTRAVIPIKPFGVCKGLSVRSMKHGKSCLLVRGWSAELYQGSEGALLGSFWFEMLICPTQSLLRLIEGLKMWVLAVPPLFSIIP